MSPGKKVAGSLGVYLQHVSIRWSHELVSISRRFSIATTCAGHVDDLIFFSMFKVTAEHGLQEIGWVYVLRKWDRRRRSFRTFPREVSVRRAQTAVPEIFFVVQCWQHTVFQITAHTFRDGVYTIICLVECCASESDDADRLWHVPLGSGVDPIVAWLAKFAFEML